MSAARSQEPTPLERYEAKVDQLNHALESRSVISRAQGIVMERYGLDADAAMEFLMRVSSTTNTKVRAVAEQLVEGTAIEDLHVRPPSET